MKSGVSADATMTASKERWMRYTITVVRSTPNELSKASITSLRAGPKTTSSNRVVAANR